MHIEARLFEFIAAFFVFVAALVRGADRACSPTGGVEWAGTTALALTGGLALITGTFFRFVARRLDTRPGGLRGRRDQRRRRGIGLLRPAQLVADL